MPSMVNLVRRGVRQMVVDPLELLHAVPRTLRYVDRLPGAANFPGTHLLSETAALVGRLLEGRPALHTRELRAPHPAQRHHHRAPPVRLRVDPAGGRQDR